MHQKRSLLFLSLVLSLLTSQSIFAEKVCQIPQKLMLRPTALAYQNDRLYLLGRSYETFYSINLKNCHARYIGGGEKNGFVSPLGLVDNSKNGQWIVLDSGTGMINIKNGHIKGMLGSKMPDMLSTVTPLENDPQSFIAIADRGVYKINLDTGKETVISDTSHGVGPLMQNLRSVTVTQNHIYALDYHQKKIYEINFQNGNRKIFIDLTAFKNKGIKALQPFGLTSSDHDLFVSDPEAKQLLAINLKTHKPDILNSNVTQKTNLMVAPIGLFFDRKNHNLYVSDFGRNAIYVLSITGNTTKVIRNTIVEMKKMPSYPNDMVFPVDLALTKEGNILIGDQHFGGVFKLNPKTKKLTLFSASNKGNGPIMLEGNALHTFTNNTFLLSDTSLTRIFEMDAQGNRKVFSPADNNVPGDPIWITKGDGNAWYVSSGGDSSIYQFHFNQKNHIVRSELISDNKTKGFGPSLHNTLGIVWVSECKQLIVANEGPNNLLWINPKNGNRTLLSGKNKGQGPEFDYVAGLAFAPSNTIYVADSFRPALVRVDLKTGDRTIVSGLTDKKEAVGTGPMFKGVASIALLSEKNIAYVTDPHGIAVYSINLKTGDRKLITQKID
ncbi:MAG: hypothetical protein A3E82_00010 [Gammaproteobacteria bacterium RIFCSPHIGHO2_12_FULL_38_11]|nr:MAG: hypothetical protein A3E82_00010 [Gammaproteobacteria bacterium RIFCSPHIGHO2_12_FULL_38_11]